MNAREATIHLPTVDISRLQGSVEERGTFAVDLRRTLHDHGFFYLTGHGVAPTLTRDVLSISKRFFALGEAEKLAIEMVKSPHFRGYNRAGLEVTRGEQDWREQVDIDTESDVEPSGPGAPAWKRMLGPNQWPDTLPELRPLLLRYQAEVTRVGIEVLRAIAVALGQGEDAFAPLYQPQPRQHLKIIRYPGREHAGSDQGVGAHKDGGLVTVLLQDVTPGLRVQSEGGSWIEVPPVPGTFIVNTGELLELATNGFVRADVHGVTTPPAGTERYSVAFFLGARYDATVPVIDLPQELKRAERGVTADPLNPLLRDVGNNHLKARLRSHPDVARAHYADLL